jgi:hypothetical protein
VVRFAERVEAAAFIAALSRFLASPRGRGYTDQPDAVEVWVSVPALHERVEVYLSDAAVEAVIAGFMSIPIADARLGSALPTNCTRVLDDDHAPAWGLQEAQRHLNMQE